MKSKCDNGCFDDQALVSFLQEENSAKDESGILMLIESCSSCRNRLEQLSGALKMQDDLANNLGELHELAETLDSEIGTDRQRRELTKVRDLLAPSEDPDKLGRLGNYEVCGVIGRGSAGIVVKALDPRLNRFVAIKLLAPSYSNNGCSRRRFEREGRAIASVKDPHVVPIHAVDEFNGTPYIVMQYLPDGSLFQRIQRQGPMSTEQVACVGLHIAKGLAAAHARGIVHRDVKPANVLLENGLNNAMVTDFGLARVVDEATMTRSGSISGTPQYMSPEQAKGERVDARSDLFSLGSVMYTACTGQSPFQSGSVFGVIKKVCESEPDSLREYNPDTAEWLVALIERLHQKEPSDRFESADEVAEILAGELAHLQSPSRVQVPSRDWWIKPIEINHEAKTSKTEKAPAVSFHWSQWLITVLCVFLLATVGFMMIPESWWAGNESNGKALVGISIDNPSSSLSYIYTDRQTNDTKISVNGKELLLLNNTTPPAPISFEGNMSPQELLIRTSDDNEKQQKFTKTYSKSLNVKTGGKLFVKTNLGRINFTSHDQPNVEMKMMYSVGADSKEIAEKLFDAVTLKYDLDQLDAAKAVDGVRRGNAVIIADFPVTQLTSKEIQKAQDLEELKEQLLVRNNSHSKNVEFFIRIPKELSLNVVTGSGTVQADDLSGDAIISTQAGDIVLGNIGRTAKLRTSGGSIEVGDIGGSGNIATNGGHVDTGNVQGALSIETHGGHIDVGNVLGELKALTHGGHIEIDSTSSFAFAESHGGSVTVHQASQEVELTAHSGPIRVNFVDQPTKPSKIESHSGAIRIGCVEGVDFQVDAKTQTGSIKIDAIESSDSNCQLMLRAKTGAIKAFSIDKAKLAQERKRRNKRRQEQLASSRASRDFNRGYDIHMAGRVEEAIHWHKKAAGHPEFKGIATYNLGCAYALLGRTDDAFKALEDAIEFGFLESHYFKEDTDLDSLREDPRFEQLMTKLSEANSKERSSCD